MVLLVALIAIGIAYMRPAVTQFVDVKLGSGRPIQVGDTAIVHYVGTLADGKVFDTSKGRGQPFEFSVGRGMVIRGWEVGLLGMRPGGVRRLTIPPGDAYGEKGVPPIVPPSSTLYFEVELMGIKPGVGQGPQAAK
jgi:FKBP-type peptidyl-prolyl cis-trans isomerase